MPVSHLVLLSVGDETAAREGFDKILALHSVALLTLQGISLLGPAAGGRTVVIADPPEEVGVQHVDVVPAFAPLVESLLHPGTAPDAVSAPDHASALGDVGLRGDVSELLSRGEYVLVFLASEIAEGEVMRQLEFLNAQRVALDLSDEALEKLEPAK
jgi:uncharacterized membrane protein